MPKVSPIQSNFSSGEMSPYLYGRVETDRYKTGLKVCKNYIPMLQGGLPRRPGTKFVAEVKDSTKSTRLIPFEFSTTQAYILEFSDGFIRFYKDNAQILNAAQNITGITQANPAVVTYAGSDTFANGDEVYISGVVGMTQVNGRNFKVANVNGGSNTFELQTLAGTNVNSTAYTAYSSGGTVAEVYQIASPYAEADLFEIKYTQSADVLYLVHPSYHPRTLTRTGHTSWTLASVLASPSGPYQNFNLGSQGEDASSVTLTPASTANLVTPFNVTASGSVFGSATVGQVLMMKHSSTWGFATIREVVSDSVVKVTTHVDRPFGATTASTLWRLGAWSDYFGYPSTVTFHEDRLFFGGPVFYPNRFDGSVVGKYGSFYPVEVDGTVLASNAVSFTLNANDVNTNRWMTSDEKGLLIGTVGGEWVVRPADTGEAISPTNISAKRATSYGSADVQPIQAGKATLFVQRAGRKLRELTYFYDTDGYRAPDLSLLSEHITASGIKQLALQKEPQQIVWAVRTDGTLVGMTYQREEELVMGWHRHELGGYVDAASNPAQVESVAVIPSADGTRDELWLVVKRRINGGTKRYIEYVTKMFDDETDQQDAYFVDAGITYDSPKTITGITAANPAVVTSNSHGFSNGNTVILSEIEGMIELNGNIYTVANVTANTFELSGVNSSTYTAYVSGGEARKRVSTVSGLWHLEGQTVSILGDGAKQPVKTVASGAITLETPAAVVQVGLGYSSDGQMLRIEAGAADGTALGKTRRINHVAFLLHRTLGLKIGMSFDEDDMDEYLFPAGALSQAPPLFSGIIDTSLDANYDFENLVCWRQDSPLPATILAVMPQMTTQDRG